MDFLSDFKKQLANAGFEEGSSKPPRYWYSTGNFVVNQILSGQFNRGIPQGRITGLTGPSGSGKSFVASNIIREAQKEGAHILVLDSENALDDDFVANIGVDPTTNYNYVAVDTIPQVQKVVSSFIGGYKKDYGDDPENGPQVLIVIDSLDMLMTETEEENFDKGITKGDQGQRNKQLKAMLRQFVQAIKHYNIAMIVTAQVYKNQDVLNGEGVWIVSDAIRYSLSQIALLTKLKLRAGEGADRSVAGIRMKVEGFKTRFTKPFQTVTIEVPYDTGMDPYNGLLDVAVDLGVVEKKGSRFAIKGSDESWYSKDFAKYADEVLKKCDALTDKFLDAQISDEDLDKSAGPSAKSRRAAKADKDEE